MDSKQLLSKLPFMKARAGAAPKPLKPRRMTVSPGAKYILLIGDEGAILIYMKGRVVKSRQFVPDAGEQNLSELRTTLEQDPKAPVTLVIDSIDQNFAQHTLPPVSRLSVHRMIKRRLDREFAPDDIKGAIVLGREKSGRKDWSYAIVSVDKSPQLTLWLDFVLGLENRFRGIQILSVEMEHLMKAVDRGRGIVKSPTTSEWKFLVSHHKVGGFRQVVLRNGRTVFTRLSQPIGESTPEVIAGNIEQEMLNTLEYMKRLAFETKDGLDVMLIVSAGVKGVIDLKHLEANEVQIYTPHELAEMLGIEGGTQTTDQFGDVVLASAIGASPRALMMLSLPETRSLDLLFQLLAFQRVGAIALGVSLIAYSGMMGIELFSLGDRQTTLTQQKTEREKQLADIKQKIADTKLDLDKTNDLIDIYKQMLSDQITPLPFIAKIGTVVKAPILMKALEWNVGPVKKDTNALGASAAAPPRPGEAEPEEMTVTITLQFPEVARSADAFRAISNKVLEDVKAVFPDYDVSYTQAPSGFIETEKLELSFGTKTDGPQQVASTGAPIEAKLTVRGPIMNDPVDVTAMEPKS